MPSLAPDETLHEVWHALGEARDGKPLEWQELQAYANMTGKTLTAEEWETVYDMSRAYCSEMQNRSPFAVSPMEKAQADE
ncbi:hypothetical protein [Yoonia sp.]|uniref:hypothetical protein n=1 Tax=Yoonia sp. TaxID=2212373 RepID=UPI002DFC775E|nr:hypothetical protein [Yoonia sp.]